MRKIGTGDLWGSRGIVTLGSMGYPFLQVEEKT
jgi:hypothetical protein